MTKSYFRFLHNIEGAQQAVDVYVDGKAFFYNLEYQDLTAYLPLCSGKHTVAVYDSVTANIVTKNKFELSEKSSYTLVGIGNVSDSTSLNIKKFKDITKCPNNGKAYVHFVHVAYGAPTVDVYLDNTLAFGAVSYSTSSDYAEVPLGNLTLTVKETTSGKSLYSTDLYTTNGSVYELYSTLTNNNAALIISNENSDGYCDTYQKSFNAAKYLGKWYQIAALPTPYEQGCDRAVAEYTAMPNWIKVVNYCFDKEWKLKGQKEGTAVALNAELPAALTVKFPDLASDYNTPANYLVHKTDYTNYSVVGSPNRSALFILCRKEQMVKCEYKKLKSFCGKLGYDTKNLVLNYDSLKKC